MATPIQSPSCRRRGMWLIRRQKGGVLEDKAIIVCYTEKLVCIRHREDHVKNEKFPGM